MKTRLFVVAVASLLLLGPTMAWSQTVVRMLHIEDDPEKVTLVDLKRLGLVHINDTTLKRTPKKSFDYYRQVAAADALQPAS